MANILVTGGAGYVGSVCCRRLLELGHSVTIVDDLSTGHADAVPSGAKFYRFSIDDRSHLSALVQSQRFDAVFHFAAKALIPESVTNPGAFFDANVRSGISMLETIRAAGIRRFVYSSSAAVYGTPERTPITETHPKEPVNAYGESKLMLERALEWYARAYGWGVASFRYFNASGAADGAGEAHDPETHLIPLALQASMGLREYLEIYGADYPTPDGTCVRDYVHVLDIADAHVRVFDRLQEGVAAAYNIGTGTGHTVREICSAIERVTGRKVPVRVGPRRPGDPAVLCASPKKIMEELGWNPTHSSLENIIASACQWQESMLASEGYQTQAGGQCAS
jgi:UDP-glucose 4-epimerase